MLVTNGLPFSSRLTRSAAMGGIPSSFSPYGEHGGQLSQEGAQEGRYKRKGPLLRVPVAAFMISDEAMGTSRELSTHPERDPAALAWSGHLPAALSA